jgi:hypothetical protein
VLSTFFKKHGGKISLILDPKTYVVCGQYTRRLCYRWQLLIALASDPTIDTCVEQSKHTASPQLRQWCRRRTIVKARVQNAHAVASLSFVGLRASTATDVKTGGCPGRALKKRASVCADVVNCADLASAATAATARRVAVDSEARSAAR